MGTTEGNCPAFLGWSARGEHVIPVPAVETSRGIDLVAKTNVCAMGAQTSMDVSFDSAGVLRGDPTVPRASVDWRVQAGHRARLQPPPGSLGVMWRWLSAVEQFSGANKALGRYLFLL